MADGTLAAGSTHSRDEHKLDIVSLVCRPWGHNAPWRTPTRRIFGLVSALGNARCGTAQRRGAARPLG